LLGRAHVAEPAPSPATSGSGNRPVAEGGGVVADTAEAAEARDAESAARFFGRGSDGARGDIQSGRIQEADRKDGAECTAGIRETFAILGKGDGPAMTTDRLCEGRIGF